MIRRHPSNNTESLGVLLVVAVEPLVQAIAATEIRIQQDLATATSETDQHRSELIGMHPIDNIT